MNETKVMAPVLMAAVLAEVLRSWKLKTINTMCGVVQPMTASTCGHLDRPRCHALTEDLTLGAPRRTTALEMTRLKEKGFFVGEPEGRAVCVFWSEKKRTGRRDAAKYACGTRMAS